MLEAAIFGFITGAFLSGYTCFHMGYSAHKHDTLEITARQTAKIEAYEMLLSNTRTKREL